MAKLLKKVEETQSALLEPGESFKAAGSGQDRRPRAGNGRTAPVVNGVKLPVGMVWAVSEKRMFVWSADKLTGSNPKELLLAIDLDSVLLGSVTRTATVSTIEVIADRTRFRLTTASPDADALAAAISVGGGAPSVDPTGGDERAAEFLAALQQSDWSTAERVFEGLATAQEREFFCYLMPSVPGRPPGLDAWVESRPASATALLVRGAHSIAWAWEERGRGPANTVTEDSWQIFYDRLRQAERDLLKVTGLDSSDPSPWSLLVVTARGLQIPKEELRLRFDQADDRARDLYRAHLQALYGLGPWWDGSDTEMFAFAREVARAADDGSVLHSMVPVVHLEGWQATPKEAQPAYWESADVRLEIIDHANRSVFDPAWIDAPYTVEAANVFAGALAKCQERSLAQSLLQRVGARRSEYPWRIFEIPDRYYLSVLRGL
jgi:hypothetical protein